MTINNPDPSESLVSFLRSRGFNGTKLSCGEGSCGSCTVLLARLSGPHGEEFEEVSINACTTLLISLHGTRVTTVEGVGGTRDGLHPVQVWYDVFEVMAIQYYPILRRGFTSAMGRSVASVHLAWSCPWLGFSRIVQHLTLKTLPGGCR